MLRSHTCFSCFADSSAHSSPCTSFCAGEAMYLLDMFIYDPAAYSWAELTAPLPNAPVSARKHFGFASVGSKLYVHGGTDSASEWH
jgi:N-acetylneuraminic acid mutarotase